MSDADYILKPDTGFASPDPSEDQQALLAIENDLWEAVLANPEEQEKHNVYFSFVTRNNLLKEGSRRYGAMIEAKDDYSIAARRQFREFQKNIVNLMFITGPREIPEQKRTVFEFFGYLFIPFMIAFGLVMSFYGSLRIRIVGVIMFAIGVISLAALLYVKIKIISGKIDREKSIF